MKEWMPSEGREIYLVFTTVWIRSAVEVEAKAAGSAFKVCTGRGRICDADKIRKLAMGTIRREKSAYHQRMLWATAKMDRARLVVWS